MKGVVLEIVRGPDAGRKFTLEVGHYRVIGRAYGVMGGTAMISQGERRRLDAEDQRVVSDHLRRRASPNKPGARAEVSSFIRDDDVDLADDAVSQTHAMIFADEAGVSLVDVASTNGCSVNGNRTGEAEVVDGDLIRVGETRIEVAEIG
jgi:hypothetical protein